MYEYIISMQFTHPSLCWSMLKPLGSAWEKICGWNNGSIVVSRLYGAWICWSARQLGLTHLLIIYHMFLNRLVYVQGTRFYSDFFKQSMKFIKGSISWWSIFHLFLLICKNELKNELKNQKSLKNFKND